MCKRLPNIISGPSLDLADWDWGTEIPPNPCKVYDKQDSYILWATGELNQQLERLKSYYNAWNARGRFLVVLERTGELPMILEELRQWKILNVVVLTPSSSEQDAFELYSWFPYQKPSGECGKLREAVLVDKCIAKREYLLRNASLFSAEFPNDLGGCPITVSTFPLDPHVMIGSNKDEGTDENGVRYTEGLDIRLINFMAKSLNASVRFLPPPPGDWSDFDERNYSWRGIVGDLIFRRADIGMCGTSYAFSFIRDLDLTVSYDVLEAVWVVPRAKVRPRWSSITRVFRLPMWLLLMAVMIVASVTMICLSKYQANYEEERSEYTTLSDCLSSAWAAMMGVAVARQPRTGPMRFFFIAWVIYSLAVSTVFQTFVSSFLVDPGLEKQIANVEDILSSGIRYGLHKTFQSFLYDLPGNQRDVMMNHTETCVKVEECALRVADQGNYATILASITAEYLNTYKTLDSTGVGKLYMLDEAKLWTNFQVFILPRGSEFLGTFNRLLSVAKESGLVTHFWKEMLTTATIKGGSIRTQPAVDDYAVFTLTYLQSAFYLLVLGHCIALCMFLAELMHRKWRTIRRHKMADRKRGHGLRRPRIARR
ncbi:glutamate receptor-like [Zootermopsis nevadensis]|nr:glutamate receptor-like [Zootermopsis nevadensis]XP_021929669.1 glutamate receptor-like [Zootermopsis nevadensis]